MERGRVDNSGSRNRSIRRARAAGGLWAATALIALVGGCAGPPRPPVTLDELAVHNRTVPPAFTAPQILQYNLYRVMDNHLDDRRRIASLSVLLHLDGTNPDLHRRLIQALSPPGEAPVVQQVILHVLAQQDCPDIGPHVAMTLPIIGPGRLQEALMGWLQRHPQPELLAEIVRHWARADRDDTAVEADYRRLVATTAARPWAEALIEGLNRPTFLAKGSALALLRERLADGELRKRLTELEAKTTAVEALQFTIDQVDYIPAGADLLAVVVAYGQRKAQLAAAATVAKEWSADNGYRFHIRDLHLLSRLAAESTGRPVRRDALIASLDQHLTQQTYNWTAGVPETKAAAGEVDFAGRLRTLSTADLVRIDLLWRMLNRGETQRSLRITAERDRDDKTSQWGGLVIYLDGKAAGRLYLPGRRGDDQAYRPSDRLIQDAMDCLVHFHCRFDAPRHADTGPTGDDRLRLAALRSPGLILTSTSEDHFAAVYYDADGAVIPLGTFQFAR